MMIVTERTKRLIANERFVRRLEADGYEKVGENGGRLWEIYRGYRIGQVITDAVVPPDGMSVYVKIEPGSSHDT